MKLLLVAAAVFLVLDFCGFGKGRFKTVSGILAICLVVIFALYLLGIILELLIKIILLLLGVYIVLRLIYAIKDTLK